MTMTADKDMQLKPKDRPPGFELLNQDGEEVCLSSFRGSKVLLFFYRKAGTSG